MITKAVLLCGGLATRLLPITKAIPKEMLPIINRPAIDYCIEDLRANGIKDILIVLGRNKECIENYYDRHIELENRLIENNDLLKLDEITRIYKDINITFIRQREAKGTGFATKLAKNFVGTDNFILLYPDDLIIGESLTKQLINQFKKTPANVIPLKKINISDCNKYGMVGFNKDTHRITQFIEKPDTHSTPSDICYIGSGIFSSEIFKYLEIIPSKNGEHLLTDTFDYLINSHSLYGVEIIGERIDIGTPLGFLKSNIIAGLNNEKIKYDLLDFLTSTLKKDT